MFSILRRHGVSELFRGLEAKLLQTVLTSALMFVAYEVISDAVFSFFGAHAPTPEVAILRKT